MGHEGIWRTEPEGVLAAEAGGFRLVVQAPCGAGGGVRFLVMRQEEGQGRSLVGSGNEESVRAAMAAAIRMAERMSAGRAGASPGRSTPRPS